MLTKCVSISLPVTLALFSGSAAYADALSDVCMAMVTNAAHNVGINTSSSSYLDSVYSHYCEASGATNNSAMNAGVDAVVEGIPVGLTLGSADTGTAMKNFCSKYQATYAANSTSFGYKSVVVEKALDAADDCIKTVTAFRTPITYSILSPSKLSISFMTAPGQTVDIRAISADKDVSCVGSNVSGPGTITYAPGAGQKITAAAGTYTVSCDRKPNLIANGASFYSAAAIVVDTSMGPLDIYWPQETALPILNASQIQTMIAQTNQRLDRVQAAVNFNLLPIGTILPWDVANQDPPPGWAKCDGSDTGHCPDLTDRFLMGAKPAGGVGAFGGGESINLVISGGNAAHRDGDGWSRDGDHWVNDNRPSPVPKPPFMKVVYIMKVANS